MTERTLLDDAHALMEAQPDDDAPRLRFYERLAASELFLMLAEEVRPGADNVTPELFDVGSGQVVLVFDRLERLASFAGQTAPYVALSGRNLVAMIAGKEIGLGVNLDVAPSSILLPAQAVSWLHETLGNTPDEIEAQIAEVLPPAGLPPQLIEAIDAQLATAMGLAHCAYLVGVTFDTGARGHMLAFVDAVPQAQDALARAAGEALTFSGIEAGMMDVGFFQADAPVAVKMERVGLRFDLPQMQQSVSQTMSAPGMDPEKPPKLT